MTIMRGIGNIFLVIVLPLLLGWIISIYAMPKPAVGVIRLNGDIWAGSAELLKVQIEEARKDPNIRAIVVQIASGGGEVVASQTMYFELQNLRKEMPVVGSIDVVAASGAYYAAMAVDPIFAKPSSIIGNVGVWSFAPPDLAINDVILASGPFKLTASSRDDFVHEIDLIKQEFLETVYSQRADRLNLTRAELSQGLAYKGRQAQLLGMIDELGSQTDAIEYAAAAAGLRTYDVVDLQVRAIETILERGFFISDFEEWDGAADPVTGKRKLDPGIYLLYDVRLRGAQ